MYCENCGARIDDDSKFCENCGVLIKPEADIKLPEWSLEPDKQSGRTSELPVAASKEEAQSITDLDQLMKMDLEDPEDLKEPEDPKEPEVPENTPEPGADEISEDPKEPEPEALFDAREELPVFCMACGKQLPNGAAFCDTCGTPTGEVSPVQINRRAGQGMFVQLAKYFFVKPTSTIEKAASDDAFLSGIGFFLIKDAILAVLAAIFAGRLYGILGFIGARLLVGDPFGFGAKVFLISILMDVLWIGLLYGACAAMKARPSIKALTGSCGTSSLIFTAVLTISIILAAFVPEAIICAGLTSLVVFTATMAKAVSAAVKDSEDRLYYILPGTFVCYILILSIIVNVLA